MVATLDSKADEAVSNSIEPARHRGVEVGDFFVTPCAYCHGKIWVPKSYYNRVMRKRAKEFRMNGVARGRQYECFYLSELNTITCDSQENNSLDW